MKKHVPVPPASPQSAPRSLSSNIVANIAGSAALNLARLGVLILIAKLTSPDTLGSFTYGLALAAPIALFFGLELRPAYVSDATGFFTFGAYRALRKVALGLGVVLAAGLLIFDWSAGVAATHLSIVAGVLAGRLALAWSELGWGVMQRRERIDLMAVALALRGAAMLLPVAACLLAARYATGAASGDAPEYATVSAATMTRATVLAVWLAALGSILAEALFDRRVLRAGPPLDTRWSRHDVALLAWQTLPLGLVQLLIALADSIPRFVIAQQPGDGLAALGYFGAISYLALPANIMLVAALNAASNRLALYFQTDVPAFLRLTARLTAAAILLALGLVAGAWLVGRWLLVVLFRPEFVAYFPEFMIVVAAHAFLFLSSVMGFVTTYMRRFWVQVPIHLTILAVSLAVAWLTIPHGDPVRGGAWTTLARSLAQAGLYTACAGYAIWSVLRRGTARRGSDSAGLRDT